MRQIRDDRDAGYDGRLLTYDGLGNLRSSADDAQVFFDRSLGGAVTYGTSAVNQLTTAAMATSSNGSPGSLSAKYDAAGNLVQLSLLRSGPCTSVNGCNQLFEYDWDEIGNLARARRYDFVAGTTCKGGITPLQGMSASAGGAQPDIVHPICTPNPLPSGFTYPALPTAAPRADVSYGYDAGGTRVLRASSPSEQATTYSAEIFPSLRLNHVTWDPTSLAYDESDGAEAVYLTLGGAAYGRVVYNPEAPVIAGYQHVFLELTDGLGSTSIVIDRDTSELVERTTYLPYGGLDSDYRPDRWLDFREDYKFTGKEDDVEIGLTYFGARYYSPQLGIWISPDPLAIHTARGDLNPYAYVHGRVTTGVDPDGLDDGGTMTTAPFSVGSSSGSASSSSAGSDSGTGVNVVYGNETDSSGYALPSFLTSFLGGGGGSIAGIGTSVTSNIGPVMEWAGAWAGVIQDLAATGIGFAYGAEQAMIPGFPSNAPPGLSSNDSFRNAQALGQIFGGASALTLAEQGVGVGGGLAVASAPETFGAGAAPGLALAAVSIAYAGHGAQVAAQGIAFLATKGSSGGSRAGKSFTPKGKEEIDAANAAENGGVNKCADCGTQVEPGQKSESGVRPPDNERQRDHIIPRSRGGNGDPTNGQVLCRLCNLNKSDK